MDVVFVKLYNINSSDLIFGIGDGLVIFKQEDESTERMKPHRLFNVMSVIMNGKHDDRGSIQTFSKLQEVMCTLLKHKVCIRI